VKHLLIILSFLLLSSPLFGQETGVLYQYETSSGFVWKTFGNEKLQPKYEGQITFGEPNGHGTFTNPDGEKYVGEWKNGKHHGQGTYTFHDGVKWVGVWIKSEPWNITKYDKDGKIYGRKVNGVRQ